MEWQQIIGFYHVAKLGSFTKAGAVTLRSQSALSQQIKALEEEFGCQFFERIGTRRLKLTPAGKRFLEFSESVLRDHEVLGADLSEFKSRQSGPLKIAAPFTTLYHLFPARLQTYLERFPQVALTLLDRPQGSVIKLTRDGTVDFGLALESIVPEDLTSIRWQEVVTVLMVPRDHALVRTPRVSWRQLAEYPLILPPGELKYPGRIVLEEQLQKLGLQYRIAMESSNVELSSLYVESGLGISLATVVRNLPLLSRRNLAFLPLEHYFKPDHIALVMRKDKVLALYQRVFVNILVGESAPAGD